MRCCHIPILLDRNTRNPYGVILRDSLLQTSFLKSVCLSNSFFCRVDSIMLVEEGFTVTSVDASDKMLKYALKERWNRRKEDAFDNWGNLAFVWIKTVYLFIYFTLFISCAISTLLAE